MKRKSCSGKKVIEELNQEKNDLKKALDIIAKYNGLNKKLLFQNLRKKSERNFKKTYLKII